MKRNVFIKVKKDYLVTEKDLISNHKALKSMIKFRVSNKLNIPVIEVNDLVEEFLASNFNTILKEFPIESINGLREIIIELSME